MGFSNPVVGGNTLIRAAIQSPNYVPGGPGWAIKRDGTSEFAGLTIDGGKIVLGNSGQIFVYNGTPALGSLVISIAPTAGTDSFGNAYPGGFSVQGSDGTKVTSWLRTATSVWLSLQPQNQALNPGSISVSGSGSVGTITIAAPKPAGIASVGSIDFNGGGTGPGIVLRTSTQVLVTGGDLVSDNTNGTVIVDATIPAEVVAFTGLTNSVTSVTPTYASLASAACLASITNPSLTHGLEVEVKYSGWMVANGSGVRGCTVATGSNTINSGVGNGGAASWGEILYMGSLGTAVSMQHWATYTVTIPAGGVTTFELQACRDSATGTEAFNYPVLRLTPIRFTL